MSIKIGSDERGRSSTALKSGSGRRERRSGDLPGGRL
jgi:hypothetical protein